MSDTSELIKELAEATKIIDELISLYRLDLDDDNIPNSASRFVAEMINKHNFPVTLGLVKHYAKFGIKHPKLDKILAGCPDVPPKDKLRTSLLWTVTLRRRFTESEKPERCPQCGIGPHMLYSTEKRTACRDCLEKYDPEGIFEAVDRHRLDRQTEMILTNRK